MVARNVNKSYVVSRTAALPEMVKLEATSGKSVQEQLRDVLQEHQVKLIDLFRDWDEDGNGAIDKKEMRFALPALGYDVPKQAIDAFFDSIDVDKSGMIEFHELKAAISVKGAAAATKKLQADQAAKVVAPLL